MKIKNILKTLLLVAIVIVLAILVDAAITVTALRRVVIALVLMGYFTGVHKTHQFRELMDTLKGK